MAKSCVSAISNGGERNIWWGRITRYIGRLLDSPFRSYRKFKKRQKFQSFIVFFILVSLVLLLSPIQLNDGINCTFNTPINGLHSFFDFRFSGCFSNAGLEQAQTTNSCTTILKVLVHSTNPVVKLTALYQNQKLPDQYDYLKQILLKLRNADYDQERVCLHVFIINEDNKSKSRKRLTIFPAEWPHGDNIISYTFGKNDMEVLASLWDEDESQYAWMAVLDLRFQSLDINHGWYKKTKAMVRKFSKCTDVIGYSVLEPIQNHELEELVSSYPARSLLWQGGMETGLLVLTNFKYWKLFVRWLEKERMDRYLWPMVLNIRTSRHSKWNMFNGTVVAPWTMWFCRFSALYDVYTLYSPERSLRKQPVSRSDVCKTLLRAGLDGNEEINKHVQKSRVPNEVVASIHDYSQDYDNTISLTVVNEAFLETAKSWICNVDIAGFRPPGLVWVAVDENTYRHMKMIPRSYTVRLDNDFERKEGLLFGRAGYWRLMLERTYLIRDLLEKGTTVLLFETDQVWLRNPIPYIHRVLNSDIEIDLVSTIDAGKQLAGNFLFFRATLPMRKAYREVCHRFEREYSQLNIASWNRSMNTLIQNDQSLLSNKILHDQSFRQKYSIVLRILDQERFVSGLWYNIDGGLYNTTRSRSPIIINNNWIQGTARKTNRLKMFGHWFMSNGTCNGTAVQQAITENEERFGRSGVYEIRNIVESKTTRARGLVGADVLAKYSMARSAISLEKHAEEKS